MITAGDIRKGVIFDDGTSTDPKNPNLYLVVDFQHVKPGKGAAFVRTKLKNIMNGNVIEKLTIHLKRLMIFLLNVVKCNICTTKAVCTTLWIMKLTSKFLSTTIQLKTL